MGGYCVTQWDQCGTLWKPRVVGLGWGWEEGSRERGHVYLWHTTACMAESNTIL